MLGESLVVVIAVGEATVDEAYNFNHSREAEFLVSFAEEVLIEDVFYTVFFYGKA